MAAIEMLGFCMLLTTWGRASVLITQTSAAKCIFVASEERGSTYFTTIPYRPEAEDHVIHNIWSTEWAGEHVFYHTFDEPETGEHVFYDTLSTGGAGEHVFYDTFHRPGMGEHALYYILRTGWAGEHVFYHTF